MSKIIIDCSVVKNWKSNSPRISTLSPSFSSIAAGKSGVPFRTPLDEASASKDTTVQIFESTCRKKFGKFGKHFISSVPYSLEEWNRLGSACTNYLIEISEKKNRPSTMQSCGSAEGVIARTIAEIGQGKIYTLTNSSTPENEIEFYNSGAPLMAKFLGKPYFEITPELLKTPELSAFSEGFDIIYEGTCFQMHARNRTEQVAWVCQNLKTDGIFICLEKCSSNDTIEYQKREDQKDRDFKEKYFLPDQVSQKRAQILNSMENHQVTLEELAASISKSFDYVVVTWNSGNFHTVIASNNLENLKKFCGFMPPPVIPKEFVNISLPKIMHGSITDLRFRNENLYSNNLENKLDL